MDLKEFKFPEVNGVDSVFPTFGTIKELLEEAKQRGFYNGHTPYNDLFSTLFFEGGKIKFKDNIDKNLKDNAWPYCRALMKSFSPKHEEKEAVCALIMSEILVP